MELTFVTDLGESFVVEIDPNMELENVMALLEAESGIPVAEQSISSNGQVLDDPKSTLARLGDKAMLMLRRKVPNPAGQPIPRDAEMMRLQILGDPRILNQLRENQPEIAEAAQNDPTRFAELLRQTQERHYANQREIERLNADPYSAEAQHKIEEAIRQQAVIENLEHAMEYSPESFGVVTMLYIPVEINGVPVKAFVDSGAQRTIMAPACAEACGIMRLLDRRYSGLAVGVGTAKILGRVHSAQIKVADLHLPCSLTIMEGRDVDLLLGLDMLKSFQACIDLSKNVLRIQGREVEFLPEHELPEQARRQMQDDGASSPEIPSAGPSSSTAQAQSFPGAGNTLGAPPAGRLIAHPPVGSSQPAQSRYPEDSIRILMDLGATRDLAMRSLDAAEGNIDVAASLLF